MSKAKIPNFPNIDHILSELTRWVYNNKYEFQISPFNLEGASYELGDLEKTAEQYKAFMNLREQLQQVFEL